MRNIADPAIRLIGRLLAAAALGISMLVAGTAVAEPRHGLSVYGDLKYGPDFAHFDWVNPDAPKGGRVGLYALGTFDNVNLYILGGRRPTSIESFYRIRIFDTLMARAWDEPDSYYGLVAESADLAEDRKTVTFRLRQAAQFHDGSPIRADDVIYSLDTILAEGHPILRNVFRGITARADGPLTVTFTLPDGAPRNLPVQIAGSLPILSKAYYSGVEFKKTTLTPPLASGPYRMTDVKQGRSMVLERVKDYWAADLPVNRGLWNFDRIKIEWFTDRGATMLAFVADEYDFREEFTSKTWAKEYDDKRPVEKGWIKRLTLPDHSPSGAQGFYFNLRRDKFADIRVRQALDLAFDYEWTNQNIFYGAYQRANSIFENSDLKAEGAPSAAELELLEPFRGQVPDAVFGPAFKSPRSDGKGGIRGNLRRAARLLKQAGWSVKDGKLLNGAGEHLTLEYLMYQPGFERILAPFINNLKRLGIAATIRLVDPAQYQERLKNFDFDVITARFVGLETPGAEVRNFWHSTVADQPGSYNYPGVKDKAVDALLTAITRAPDRAALKAATSALDRVIMHNRYMILQWYKAEHNLAFWDRFGRPDTKPAYDRAAPMSWWYDAAKATALAEKVKKGE